MFSSPQILCHHHRQYIFMAYENTLKFFIGLVLFDLGYNFLLYEGPLHIAEEWQAYPH
jgi:hypothetical protein